MSFLKIEKQNSIKKISLNRPELHNAFNAEMIAELKEAFSQVEEEIRGIHLLGEGKSFCAGADLAWMKSMVDFSLEENQKDSLQLYDMFDSIRNCAVPVVTEIHGNVFGGGLGLVAASDIVLSHEKTRFCFSEVKLGLAPAVISPFVIQKVSEAKSREWMLTAKVFDEKEALQFGLINDIGNSDYISERREKILNSLRHAGREAVSVTKELINQSKAWSWQERREKTAKAIAERRVSAEGQEGLKSFLEKRSPTWKIGDRK